MPSFLKMKFVNCENFLEALRGMRWRKSGNVTGSAARRHTGSGGTNPGTGCPVKRVGMAYVRLTEPLETGNVPAPTYASAVIACTIPEPSPVRVIAEPPLVADSWKESEEGDFT